MILTDIRQKILNATEKFNLAKKDKESVPELNVRVERLRNELKKHESREALKKLIEKISSELATTFSVSPF